MDDFEEIVEESFGSRAEWADQLYGYTLQYFAFLHDELKTQRGALAGEVLRSVIGLCTAMLESTENNEGTA